MNKYVISATISGLFGVALYAAFTFAESHLFKMYYVTFSLFVGSAVGVGIVYLLTRKYQNIYSSPKFNNWMLIFLLVNQFMGIVSGLVIGIFTSWLLLFPYSVIFGHPESSNWSPLVAHMYMLLTALVVIASLGFFSKWFFKGGIAYLQRKTS